MKTMEEPLVMEEQPLDVGSSIGIAAFPDHGNDATTLIRYADVAMYAAKRNNSGYAIYNPSHDEYRREHLSLLGELRRAITNNELVLHYQPKANFKHGRAAQAEALLRWNHPHRGAVSPAEFIPFAEQTGYIRVLTRWVIETAFRQCGIWRATGLTITVSINISTRDLLNPMLPSSCRRQSATIGFPRLRYAWNHRDWNHGRPRARGADSHEVARNRSRDFD